MRFFYESDNTSENRQQGRSKAMVCFDLGKFDEGLDLNECY